MTETPRVRWPLATEDQRRYLRQLMYMLNNPSPDTSWTETETKIIRMGFMGVKKEVKTLNFDLYDAEKNRLRSKFINRIYDQVRGTPAEEYFRRIMARNGS